MEHSAVLCKNQSREVTVILGSHKRKEYQPYALLSLMDLIEVDAGSIYVSSEILATSWPVLVAGNDLSPTQWENVGRVLYNARALCEESGSQRDLVLLDRIDEATKAEDFSRASIGAMLKELQSRLTDDLSTQLVFIVPYAKKKFFEEIQFPTQCVDAFPSAVEDMVETGKCFALSRYTASVMHCSRIVEVGLKCLAEEVGVKLRPDWGRQITDINSELEKRYKTAGSRTPDELFFSESASQIGHVKNAWRNPTMHVDRRYNEEVAMDIFNAVKALMRHLATRLKEKT
jgi:hypothetical protein